MTHLTTTIIRQEHAALAAMLRSMLLLLARHRREGTLPDFGALRAMLFYVDEFPEQRHHRKESDLLFPKLRGRTPMSRELLANLSERRGGFRASTQTRPGAGAPPKSRGKLPRAA